MELQRGQVVRSLAGHDQGDFQVVVAAAPPLRLCVRWKAPALTAAQAEEAFHLAATGTILSEEALRTDRQIRSALRPFRERAGNM